MAEHEKVNILLVDDQPAKLLSYEVILHELGENLIKASSGQEALEYLLKTEVAVVLMDVCMPDLDGFQLAAMIREHPRFQKTAMIFISAIHLSDMDRLRGYEMGAVDYVPVPVIPEVLRAKVRIFVELYRKTRQLEKMNAELEERVSARTAELEASTSRLRQSEESRSLALAAGSMGSWDWDRATGECLWDDGQYGIFGVNRKHFGVTAENVRALIHPEDWRGSLVHRHGGAQHRRLRPGHADQRRDGGHHRSQDCRRTASPAGPRGRPSRQERTGAGAVDRAPDPGQ
jgi:DNA-binding response OmpR family regulator